MSYRILHLLGSPTDEFSFQVSLMYSKALAVAEYPAAKFHTNLYAVVHPGGKWSFPEIIVEDEIGDAKTFDVASAMEVVKEMQPDLMVQHILCSKRPLYNALFEILNIPYIGSNSEVTANIIDKKTTRALLLQAGLPVPRGVVVTKGDTEVPYIGPFPAVVKPCKMENSVGVEIVRDMEQMTRALEEAFTYGDHAVVDTFIPGREIRCGVIEKAEGEIQALPCLEYKVNCNNIRGYSDKLEGESSNLKQAASTKTWFVDEKKEPELVKRMQGIASKVHKVMGCKDFSQIDCRVSLSGEVFILEVNSFCSFGPLSLMTKLAEKQGIQAGDFYTSMVNYAISRQKKENMTRQPGN